MSHNTKPHPMAKHFRDYFHFQEWRRFQENAASDNPDPLHSLRVSEYCARLEEQLYRPPRPQDPHDKQKSYIVEAR